MDLDRLWKNTQEELRVIMAPAVYQTFVAKTQLISLKANQITLACPNAYLADINRKRYYDLFKGALDNQTKQDTNIIFIIQESINTDSTPAGPLFSFNQPSFSDSQSPSLALATAGLHPKYTFDTLVVGNSNNFAFAAAQGIVKNPGLSYNPLFIWGGVGVGKTHLMQAVGHELLRIHPEYKIRYFPAETFGNELISALKSKDMNRFKNKYRQLDCILVDDVQFIAGKEYIQEEFFHTFNALHMAGKQVVLTSDRKPSDLKGVEDRLVSRFLGGLTVDVQLPDFEMRCAILNQRAESRGITISSEAVAFIAENVQSNIRDLEGKLQELSIQSMANSSGLSAKAGEIDLNFTRNFFDPSQKVTSSEQSSKLNPRHVISVCAKYFNIKTGELCGNSRKKEMVTARHITAFLLLTEVNLPLEEVGRLLGGRDHTSIMHARDKIHTELSTNPQTQQLIRQLKAAL